MRDNGRDSDVLKYLSVDGKTNKEIYAYFTDIMNNTLYSMLKRFIRDGQVAKVVDENSKGGNGQALLRYKALDVRRANLPKAPSFLTKTWGNLPSPHSVEMSRC